MIMTTTIAKRKQLRTKRGQPWPWPKGMQPRTQENDHNHDDGKKEVTKNTRG
jgi:hypothetical protein